MRFQSQYFKRKPVSSRNRKAAQQAEKDGKVYDHHVMGHPNGAPSYHMTLQGGGYPQHQQQQSPHHHSLNTPLPSSEFAATHPRPAAAALNFAASFAQSQAPKDRHPPAPSAINVAASFANNRAASSTPRSDNAAADPDHKRPRLPVNMDAARAAAARRMRQGDNHADFMPPADVAPMGGDIPRISVSDINLSELGPIEEMWRVSSDMNRLSL
ncbi:hypothetical protein B5M09_001500 [Aphanomyces astaci]|uniref:Uncharacterized protein n=1 Tax=Aphanomyces astaci TaxID=112090 RepID=A0A3R7YRU4_APHAT|nr:hypothetical protein B5M09_001500 [Aphanomyces astaci]